MSDICWEVFELYVKLGFKFMHKVIDIIWTYVRNNDIKQNRKRYITFILFVIRSCIIITALGKTFKCKQLDIVVCLNVNKATARLCMQPY